MQFSLCAFTTATPSLYYYSHLVIQENHFAIFCVYHRICFKLISSQSVKRLHAFLSGPQGTKHNPKALIHLLHNYIQCAFHCLPLLIP